MVKKPSHDVGLMAENSLPCKPLEDMAFSSHNSGMAKQPRFLSLTEIYKALEAGAKLRPGFNDLLIRFQGLKSTMLTYLKGEHTKLVDRDAALHQEELPLEKDVWDPATRRFKKDSRWDKGNKR